MTIKGRLSARVSPESLADNSEQRSNSTTECGQQTDVGVLYVRSLITQEPEMKEEPTEPEEGDSEVW